MVRLGSFHARTFPELERHAERLPWNRFVPRAGAVHFRVTAKKSKLNHERAIAERFGRFVQGSVGQVDIVESRGELDQDERSVTEPVPVQRFVIRLIRDQCTVSADSSGPLLHRRGYRVEVAKAPLRETLAAALLVGAGWDGTSPLIDPFAGSGTIPIEAALLARRIPPGWNRRFAFEQWPSFDRALYRRIRSELEPQILPSPPSPIVGSDRDEGAIRAAVANAERGGVGADVAWRRSSLSALEPPPGIGLVATNPPYGERIGHRDSLRDLYAQLGNVARRKLAGWRLVLLSGDRALDGQTRLTWAERARTENGGLRVRIIEAAVPVAEPVD